MLKTTPAAASHQRLLIVTVLIALAMSLSGCVYLRLLKFKNQLKDWDTYVAVQDSAVLELTFPSPVLRGSDFVFITDSEPTRKQLLSTDPKIEEWEWAFQKEMPSDDAAPFEIVFTTRFESNLLAGIVFDSKLTEAIPKAFITSLFRSMGKAKINTLKRSASAKVDAKTLSDVPLPSLKDIESVMGEPTKRTQAKAKQVWRYVFNFYNPKNEKLSGQFKIDFRGEESALEHPISGFEVTGKAR